MVNEERKVFSAEVRDVFSGDDLVLMVDLGVEDLHKKKRIRLHGVDTPNAVGLAPDTEAGQLRAFVYQLLHKQKLTITVVSIGKNSWVSIVDVHTPGGVLNLNDELVKKGYKFKREKVA